MKSRYKIGQSVWVIGFSMPEEAIVRKWDEKDGYQLQALPLPSPGDGALHYCGVKEDEIFLTKLSCLQKMHSNLVKWHRSVGKKLQVACGYFTEERKLERVVVRLYRHI